MRTVEEIYIQSKTFRYITPEGEPRKTTILPEDMTPEEYLMWIDHKKEVGNWKIEKYRAFMYKIEKKKAKALRFNNVRDLISAQYQEEI